MLVIIGPSASGKTQIVNSLIQFYKMKKWLPIQQDLLEIKK